MSPESFRPVLRFGALLLVALVVATGTVPPRSASAQEDGRRTPDPRRGYVAPQLARNGEGSVVMAWLRPSEQGHDLLVARRTAAGALQEPRRLNEVPGSVRHLGLDEARFVLVGGPGDQFGLVWFDRDGHVVASLSRDGGRHFDGPFVVDDGEGRPENAFAGAALDRTGALHVAWLDARNAPVDMEEPALLLHAVVTAEGAGPEHDLSSEHTPSVCGCCRPFVVSGRDGVEVLFRNAGEDGYRDIHRVEQELDGSFAAPERVGPPTWKIAACPMSGPVSDGREVLWKDGSKGRPRLVLGTTDTAPLVEVFDSGRSGWGPLSPRFVERGDDPHALLLVPGVPHGRLFARRGGTWDVVVDEMPVWCRDAVVLEGQLLMVGDEHGQLRMEALDATW